MSAEVGSKAPDFTLMNQDREPVTLSAERGHPVVLAFFPAASDFNKEVIRAYGAFNEDMIGLKGIAKRSTFVIDKDGIVRHREVLDDARNEPDYQKVYDTLATLS